MRIRVLGGAALVALAICATALAAPVTIPDADDSPLELPIRDDGFFDVQQPPNQYNDDCALGDVGGPFQDDVGFTPASDVESPGGDTDTFDGGLVLWVQSQAGRSPFEDRNRVGNLNGTQIKVGPTRLRGLRVTRFERTFPSLTTLRSLIKITNPGRRAKRRTIIWDSDLGADGDEEVAASSTAPDNALTDRDRWLVFDEDPGSDPLGTLVVRGKGSRVDTRVRNSVVDADGCISYNVRLRVPPRSTRYLLFFTEAHDSTDLTEARSDAQRYDERRPAGVLGGLSDGVKSRVLNWDLAG